MRSLIGAAALVPALVLAGLTAAPFPATAGQDVVVSPNPDQSHPRVLNGRVYAIDSHGPLVAVGGSFTSIRNGASGVPDQARQWLFMYNSDTGQIVQTFLPELRGPDPLTTGFIPDQPGVESVEFAPDGQSLYVGGWFTDVNGASRQRIAHLNLDGSVRTSFAAKLNGNVKDMALVGDRLIVAGEFGRVNDQPVQRMASLDPTTGATQTDFNLPATEARDAYGSYVQEIDVSADGKWLAVAGNFQRIGNVARNQLALVDLQGTPRVANWSTDAYAPDCSSVTEDSYIRGVDISPDSSYMVISTTGAYVGYENMCDTATRWELPPTKSGENVDFTWRAKTGGDTLWASAVTESAVYVGGHQRWMNNPHPSPKGDNDGPGSVERPGITALDPLTGVPLSWNPGRDRGRGAEAIHATDDYLFVGNDTNYWGGAFRQRLAALPVAGGSVNQQPVDVELPVQLNYTDGSSLKRASFDGKSLGSPTTISGPTTDGLSWTSLRDGFVQDGKLHYFGASSSFFSRPFSDSGIGAVRNLSTSVGYVDTDYDLTPNDQPYGVAETTVATYSNGRIYYVKSGDSKLYQRGYSLESGIIEASEYVASSRSFASARALDFIGDFMYAAWSDGRLYRFHAPDGKVDYDSRTLVDNGSSVDWANVGGMWSTQASGTAVQPPVTSQTCPGATPWRAQYWPNVTLAGAPNASRCEASVNYDFGSGAPTGADLPVDNFSATWTRTVTTTAPGSIQVTAGMDDGVRAYVDGQRVINSWIDSNSTRVGTSKALAPGAHTVRIEYYERAYSARAQVRLDVVAPVAPEPEPDNLPGDTTVTTPTDNEVLRSGQVSVTGQATDNRGVSQVRVAVYNRNDAAGRWLQADGTWGANYAFRLATLSSPRATATGWSLGVALPDGDYAIDARTIDEAGNQDPDRAWRPFSVNTSSTTVDTTAPTVAVTAPAKQQQVTTSTVAASGTAADNVGVTQVRVGIYDRNGTSGARWLQANGTWGASYAFRTATLGTPGGTSTTWRLSVKLPDGAFAFDVRALDERRNETSPRAWVPFTVSTASADTVAPTVTISQPAKNLVVTTRTVQMSGSASDNQAVRQVRIGIYDRANSAAPWLQADGTWGSTYAFRTATLAGPGSASTAWDLGLDLADGSYALDVKSVDGANNVSGSVWWPFAVDAP